MNGRTLLPLSWMLAATMLLSAAPARAQQQAFAIDLHSGSQQPPEFVCVLHHGGPAAGNQLVLDKTSRPRLLAREAGRTTVTVRPTQLPSGLDPDTLAAWRAMQPKDEHGACGADHTACLARFDLTDDTTAQVVCARNAPDLPSNGKVLVVDLGDTAEKARSVEHVVVEGSSVRFDLQGPAAPDASLLARVVGGHYRPGPAARPVGHRFSLRPVPRCHTSVAEIPRHALGSTSGQQIRIELSTRGQVVAQCTRPYSRSFAFAFAQGAPGVDNALKATVASRSKDRSVMLQAHWSTSKPPEHVMLRPTEVSFSWEAPCEYAERSCPTATLPGPNLTCEANPLPPSSRKAEPRASRLTCAYRCVPSAGSAPDIAWPVTVAFQGPDPAVSWSASLNAEGETLKTYLPAAKRSFPIRFDWQDLSTELLTRPGDRIRYVEVKTPAGQTHRVEPRNGQRITLPGLRCGSALESHVVGDRAFANDTARIQDGWLVIPDPKESAHALHVGGMIGGGFILPSSRFGLSGPRGLEARSYGTAQLAVRLQPDPHVEGSIFEPRAYELHLSYVIAQQPYFPVHAPDEAVNDEAEYLAFNRWALEAMPLWQLGQRTQLGVGMGLGLGFPVRKKDEPAVGKSRLFFIPLTALGRIHISRVVSVEGSFRLVGPEKVYRYEPSPLFAGTPTRSEDTLWSGMLGIVGVRLWL